jgi:hypothetical protein
MPLNLSALFSVLVQSGAHYHRFSLRLRLTGFALFSMGYSGHPDVCCHSLLVSIVTEFSLSFLSRGVVIPRCHIPGFWIFPKSSLAGFIFSNVGDHRVVFLYIAPVEHHFPAHFSPPTRQTLCPVVRAVSRGQTI